MTVAPSLSMPKPERSMQRSTSPFDIKSASITGLALVLKTTDIETIAAELATRVQDAGDLFRNAPVLIDVSQLVDEGVTVAVALEALIQLLSSHGMQAVGIVGAEGDLLEHANNLGLVEELDIRPRRRANASAPGPVSAASPASPADSARASVSADEAPATAMTDADSTQESLFGQESAAVTPLPVGTPSVATPTAVTQTAVDIEARMQTAVQHAIAGLAAPTMVIEKPLRSGQRVYARGGDLVVLGVVSHGAEIIADGNIHVYGPLRGRAIAGANGDADARIFASAMEPELISIAGTYRTTDKPLSADVLGKPALARLDGDKLLIQALKN